MSKYWIRNTEILTMTSPEITVGDILVEDDIIRAVGTVDPAMTIGAEIVDGTNTLTMPGFVNSHMHAPMSLLRSYADGLPLMTWLNEKIFPAEDKLTDEIVYQGTMLSILEMIRSGTTTFAEMYDHMGAIADATLDSGMRAHLSRGVVMFCDDHLFKIQENVDLYEKYNHAGDDRIHVWFSVHAPYTCLPQYVSMVVDKAKQYGTGIHVHVSETKSEVEQIQSQYGKTPTVHLKDLGVFDVPAIAAHCVHLTGEDIAILKEKNVSVAHNIASNLKLASGIAPIVALQQEGINVALGTDGASSNNSLNMMKEISLCALIHKVQAMDATSMSAYEVLKMATINGAKALHWDDQIGTLEVGKKADLIMFDLKQPHFQPGLDRLADLVYAGQGSDVLNTMVNGTWLMRNRQFTTLDAEKIMTDAKIAAGKLTNA